jgi:DNA-binding MarR family transcriptional regulator
VNLAYDSAMGAHVTQASSDVRVALDAFRRIVQALRMSARDAEQRVGLSGAQLFALQQLASMPGASVNDLAARTFTHQSSVSVVVRRLVERRLVAKVAARDDRRRVRLALTDAGHAALRRSPEPIQHRLIAGIATLSSPQRHTLAKALTQVARTMAGSRMAPRMFFEEPATRKPRRGVTRGPGRRRSGRTRT